METVIAELRSAIGKYGKPFEIINDNGLQFVSLHVQSSSFEQGVGLASTG